MKYRRYLSAAAIAVITSSFICAELPQRTTHRLAKSPWNGVYVGGALGCRIIGGSGTLTIEENGTSKDLPKDEFLFPLPYHTLNVGFGTEVGCNSTLSFGFDFDYGFIPKGRLSYGILVTPLDRISISAGLDPVLLWLTLAGDKKLEISSMGGFTPSVSYERSIGNGAFFQARLSYNYLAAKGSDLGKDYKFPEPARRLIRDYWDRDVRSVRAVDASAHSFVIGLGFGYTF